MIDKIVDGIVKLGSTFSTWRRVALLAATLFIVLIVATFSIGIWDNRPAIWSTFANHENKQELLLSISEKSKTAMRVVTDSDRKILMVQVARTSFKDNARQGLWAYSKLPQLDLDFNHYMQTRTSQTPLFVVGNHEWNDRVIRIINQEFVCVDQKSPSLARVKAMMPSAGPINAMCTIALPPQNGAMVGWVSFFFNTMPSTLEQVEYKTKARILSDEIFENDIVN